MLIAVGRLKKSGTHLPDAVISSTRASAAGENNDPEATVGAERLLRGEVVDVALGHVDGEPAAPEGGVDEDEGVGIRTLDPVHGSRDVLVSLCAHA